MNRAVMKARSMAVRRMFMTVSVGGCRKAFDPAATCHYMMGKTLSRFNDSCRSHDQKRPGNIRIRYAFGQAAHAGGQARPERGRNTPAGLSRERGRAAHGIWRARGQGTGPLWRLGSEGSRLGLLSLPDSLRLAGTSWLRARWFSSCFPGNANAARLGHAHSA